MKFLKIIFYIIFSIVVSIYLIAIAIIIYIGPWKTMVVKRALKKKPLNIIVSLTTTPYRINNIQLTLYSILRQSIKPKVYVNVPKVFKRNINLPYIIPNWLKEYQDVVINRTQDYGPATKLIGTLEKEPPDPNTIIITVDDDTVYPKHMVRDFIKQYLDIDKNNLNQRTAITGISFNYFFDSNFNIYNKFHNYSIDKIPSLMVFGFGGVAYKRNFFKKDIFSLMQNIPAYCFLADDLMISIYLLANNIDIIPSSGISYNGAISGLLLEHLTTGFNNDALHKGANGMINTNGINNDLNYTNCLVNLSGYDKTKYQLLKKSDFIYSLNFNKKQQKYNHRIKKFYEYLNLLIKVLPYMYKLIVIVF